MRPLGAPVDHRRCRARQRLQRGQCQSPIAGRISLEVAAIGLEIRRTDVDPVRGAQAREPGLGRTAARLARLPDRLIIDVAGREELIRDRVPARRVGVVAVDEDHRQVVQGSVSNVIGLPMEKTSVALRTFGITPSR